MPRPQRKKVKFNAQALEEILQSVYTEIEETSVKATSQYNKQNRDVKDNQDIALVSKINADYLKIRSECSEKKLSVARLMKDIIYKDSVKTGDNSQPSDIVLSSDDKKTIFKMIKGNLDKKNIELTIDEDKKEASA